MRKTIPGSRSSADLRMIVMLVEQATPVVAEQDVTAPDAVHSIANNYAFDVRVDAVELVEATVAEEVPDEVLRGDLP